MVDGKEIVPIQVLKELLPDPASLGPRTVGKTNIGCIFTGIKDGKEKAIYIYNVCDHQECYKEVESQAISYTTGVPAMIGSMMVVTGLWKKPGVFNLEEMDPDPYMEALNKFGLPWKVVENPVPVDCYKTSRCVGTHGLGQIIIENMQSIKFGEMYEDKRACNSLLCDR